MKRLFAKTDNSVFINCFLLYVFIVLAVFLKLLLFNQNNPTAVELILIRKQD